MKVIADRDIRVATLWGAVILFEAGVQQEVSDEIGVLALQLGAKQVLPDAPAPALAPAAVPAPEPIPVPTAPFDGTGYIESDPDISAVLEAIEKIVQVGDPHDFKSDSTPKAAAVSRVLGRNVSPELREAAWDKFINS